MENPNVRNYVTSSRNQRPWYFNNVSAKWRGPKLVLGYWAIRGLAEPIRLILEFTGLPYTEKKFGPVPVTGEDGKPVPLTDESGRPTQAMMKQLGEHRAGIRGDTTTPFPNVPWLIDFKGNKITESLAIMMYICQVSHTHDDSATSLLKGHTLSTLLMIFGHLNDIRGPIIKVCYGVGLGKEMDAELDGNCARRMGYLSNYMGKNDYLNGHISFVDFVAFEYFDLLQTIRPGYLDTWPNLKAFFARVGNLPAIKAYRESDRFQARPINA